MILRKAIGVAAKAALAANVPSEELEALSLEGRMLALEVGEDQEAAIESVRSMSVFIGGLMVDEDDAAAQRGLSDLKTAVASFEQDVIREFMLLNTREEAGSHEKDDDATLTESPETAISDASNSNDADSNSNEGDDNNGTTQSKRRKRTGSD